MKCPKTSPLALSWPVCHSRWGSGSRKARRRNADVSFPGQLFEMAQSPWPSLDLPGVQRMWPDSLGWFPPPEKMTGWESLRLGGRLWIRERGEIRSTDRQEQAWGKSLHLSELVSCFVKWAFFQALLAVGTQIYSSEIWEWGVWVQRTRLTARQTPDFAPVTLPLSCTFGPPSDGSDSTESVCSAGDPGSISGSGRSPGEGNGNSLQYTCLENPMDRGAWWATVQGVSKSQTPLNPWFLPASSPFSSSALLPATWIACRVWTIIPEMSVFSRWRPTRCLKVWG